MKLNILSIVGATIVSTSLFSMDDYRCTDTCLCDENEPIENVSAIDKAFSEGTIDGNIRLAHIYQRDDAAGSKDTYGTSIGGELKYETARFYNISAAVSTFISQKIDPLSGDFNKNELNTDFFTDKGNSLAYLGEAYVDYRQNKVHVRLGRQKLDTPFNDRDDIRMLPNTFQGLTVGYGGLEHFVFMAGYVTKWAGFDSGQNISKFKDIPGVMSATNKNGKSLTILGVQNNSLENIDLQAWYYGFDKQADVLYLDGIYEGEYSNALTVAGGMQYAYYKEKEASTFDGNVIGAQVEVGFDLFTLGTAFNHVMTPDGKKLFIGYGGGPYFTSMEELTINEISDAKAYTFSVGINLAMIAKDLELNYSYGHFSGKDGASDVEQVENDLILGYEITDKLDLEISYADINDKKNSGSADTGFNRLLARMNYGF